MTMVDFGIFGFLIPLVNLLYTNTSIPTGESSYISIGSVDPKVQYSLIKEVQVKTESVNMNL